MKKLLSLVIVLLLSISTLAPIQSSASKLLPIFNSEAEQHIAGGEAVANLLNKQILIQNTKTIKWPDTIHIAFLKKAISEAKKDLPKVKNSKERVKLQTKLKALETTNTRVQYYIDGINAGKKLADLSARLRIFYKQDPLSDETFKAFEVLYSEISKQGKVLNKIYGTSTRATFIKKYLTPAQALIKEKAPVISLKKSLTKLDSLLASDASDESIENQIKIIEKKLTTVKDAAVKKNVSGFLGDIKEASAIFELYANMHQAFNEENIDAVLGNYPKDSPHLEEIKAYLTDFFAAYNVKVEIQDFSIEELTSDQAIVKIVQKNIKTDESDYRNNTTEYREKLTKVDGTWIFTGESEVISIDFEESN